MFSYSCSESHQSYQIHQVGSGCQRTRSDELMADLKEVSVII